MTTYSVVPVQTFDDGRIVEESPILSGLFWHMADEFATKYTREYADIGRRYYVQSETKSAS